MRSSCYPRGRYRELKKAPPQDLPTSVAEIQVIFGDTQLEQMDPAGNWPSGTCQKSILQNLLEIHSVGDQGKLRREMCHQRYSTPKPLKEAVGCWVPLIATCAIGTCLACIPELESKTLSSCNFSSASIDKALAPAGKGNYL